MSRAILFVHGILGNREFFDFLLPHVPADMTAVCLLLSGHGGSARDFGRASMKQWREEVHEALLKLRKTHDKVFVAAHSMGTLFAVAEAVGGYADSLFLMNPPLKIRPTVRLFTTSLKVFFNKIDADDVRTQDAVKAYGIDRDTNLLHYAGWIPRYFELFAEIRSVRPLVSQLEVPVTVFTAERDEMVSPASADYFAALPQAHIHRLSESGHYHYTGEERGLIVAAFRSFIDGLGQCDSLTGLGCF